MKTLAGLAAAAVCAALVSSCATAPRIPEGASLVEPGFLIERDLAGHNVARGEFRAITGARRAFTAQLDGAWDGRTLTLVEDFVYDDGERDRKTWRLTQTAPGRYTGTREDVVGEAVGVQDGAVFRLEYDVILPTSNGRGRRVHFRDVLARAEDGRVLNSAVVGLYGFRVGSVQLVIQRAP